MIEQQGCVVGLEGDRALVRVGAASGCPACDAGKGCGAGVFGRLLQRKPVVLNLANRIAARDGDVVRVGIPERVFLVLVTRLYLLPVVMGLAGAAIGHHVGVISSAGGLGLDLAAFVGAAVGVLLGLPRWRKSLAGPPEDTVRLLGVSRASGFRTCGGAVDRNPT